MEITNNTLNNQDFFNNNNFSTDEQSNELKDQVVKKKRGRKRKEDAIKAAIEEKNKDEENFEPIVSVSLEEKYYKDRNIFDEIIVASFLTRFEMANDPAIKDNEDIIKRGIETIERVKKMTEEEYCSTLSLLFDHFNHKDIFLRYHN